jgi:hypothetical protein
LRRLLVVVHLEMRFALFPQSYLLEAQAQGK